MSQQIDNLDIKLLQLLSDNARKPYLEIARETGVSGAAIHQRMSKLQQLGIVKGSETIIDHAAVGYSTCAYLGIIFKDIEHLDSLIDGLLKVPEVVECHLTTGQYDMIIKLYSKNNEHLLSVIREKIHTLNIGRSETIISFKEVFKRQLPIKEETIIG